MSQKVFGMSGNGFGGPENEKGSPETVFLPKKREKGFKKSISGCPEFKKGYPESRGGGPERVFLSTERQKGFKKLHSGHPEMKKGHPESQKGCPETVLVGPEMISGEAKTVKKPIKQEIQAENGI